MCFLIKPHLHVGKCSSCSSTQQGSPTAAAAIRNQKNRNQHYPTHKYRLTPERKTVTINVSTSALASFIKTILRRWGVIPGERAKRAALAISAHPWPPVTFPFPDNSITHRCQSLFYHISLYYWSRNEPAVLKSKTLASKKKTKQQTEILIGFPRVKDFAERTSECVVNRNWI